MQRFSKILFINDPPTKSKRALKRALQLARSNEAELTITSVLEELPRSMDKLQKTFRQLQEEELQTLLGELSTEGISIKTNQLIGTPFLQIIYEVMRSSHDLVIKPAEGRGGLSNMLFGSTDLHLLRKCPCPVWIIKPSQRKKYTRVLAAVDPDPGEKANAELNALILDLATSIARRENSQLHIVHAWSMIHERVLRTGRANLPATEIDRMVRDTRKAHKKWLDELLSSYDMQGLPVKIHISKGDPGEVIPALAQKKKVELIVMGTVARTGIPGFFIGNTAEKTLAEVDCSVLAVKPKAFSTPVKESNGR